MLSTLDHKEIVKDFQSSFFFPSTLLLTAGKIKTQCLLSCSLAPTWRLVSYRFLNITTTVCCVLFAFSPFQDARTSRLLAFLHAATLCALYLGWRSALAI